MAELGIEQYSIGDVPAIRVSGQLTNFTASPLRDEMQALLKAGRFDLVLDLSDLSFMDTSGLATLIEAHLRREKDGGSLVLFGVAPQIAEVFDIARVSTLFLLVETEEEAIGALEAHGSEPAE